MVKSIYCIFFLITLVFLQLSAEVYLEPSPQFKPRIEIAGVYIEYNDSILLLHRQNNKSHGNKWGIPCGKINKNETPLEAAIREVKEETNYDISEQSIEKLATIYVEFDEQDHFIYNRFHTKLKNDPGAVKINFNEHKGFTWVTPADALKMDLIKDEDSCIKQSHNIRAD